MALVDLNPRQFLLCENQTNRDMTEIVRFMLLSAHDLPQPSSFEQFEHLMLTEYDICKLGQ